MNKPTISLGIKQTQTQKFTQQQVQLVALLKIPHQRLEALLRNNPLIQAEYVYDDEDYPMQAPSETEDESLYEAELYENEEFSSLVPGRENNHCDKKEQYEDSGEYCEDFDRNLLPQNNVSDDNNYCDRSTSYATKNNFLDYTASPASDFKDELLCELNCRSVSSEFKTLCGKIITELDSHGFLKIPIEEIAELCNVSCKDSEEALTFLQDNFDPPGIAARNVAECLLLQLKRKGEYTAEFEKLLTDYAEDLIAGRWGFIAKKLSVTRDKLDEMLEQLRLLKQYPITSDSSADIIKPVVEIIRVGYNQFRCVEAGSKCIFSLYSGINNCKSDDVKNLLTQAETLLAAWNYSNSLLFKITEELIIVQHEFLIYGTGEYLKQYTQKQIAEHLGVSESVISRIIKDEYIRTPYGVFKFQDFFPKKDPYVLAALQRLIDEEPETKTLSDRQLADLLSNMTNHRIARETVTKYRRELGIPNSNLRKKND